MDQETSNYIVTYFSNLLTTEEKLAIKHISSTIKLDLNNQPNRNDNLVKVYKKEGWLTSEKAVLDLLDEGYGRFEFRVAERILKEHSEKVRLNFCPNCRRLARTPLAKQCRFCGHDWH